MSAAESWIFDLCERLGLDCGAGATWTVDDVLAHIARFHSKLRVTDAMIDAAHDAFYQAPVYPTERDRIRCAIRAAIDAAEVKP